jgi:hypothetical protein
MTRRLWPLAYVVVLLTSLMLGATPYAKQVDFLLWPLRFALLGGFSILILRSRWRHRFDSQSKGVRAPKDWGDDFVDSWKSWFYGEAKSK